MHPSTQRLDRLLLFLQPFGEIGQLLDLVAVNALEQGFACGKMAVKGADPDTGRSRDGFETRFRSAGAEHGPGGLEHPLAVPQRVDARLSCPAFV